MFIWIYRSWITVCIFIYIIIYRWTKISNLMLAPPPETASRVAAVLPPSLDPNRRLWRRTVVVRYCRSVVVVVAVAAAAACTTVIAIFSCAACHSASSSIWRSPSRTVFWRWLGRVVAALPDRRRHHRPRRRPTMDRNRRTRRSGT